MKDNAAKTHAQLCIHAAKCQSKPKHLIFTLLIKLRTFNPKISPFCTFQCTFYSIKNDMFFLEHPQKSNSDCKIFVQFIKLVVSWSPSQNCRMKKKMFVILSLARANGNLSAENGVCKTKLYSHFDLLRFEVYTGISSHEGITCERFSMLLKLKNYVQDELTTKNKLLIKLSRTSILFMFLRPTFIRAYLYYGFARYTAFFILLSFRSFLFLSKVELSKLNLRQGEIIPSSLLCNRPAIFNNNINLL